MSLMQYLLVRFPSHYWRLNYKVKVFFWNTEYFIDKFQPLPMRREQQRNFTRPSIEFLLSIRILRLD